MPAAAPADVRKTLAAGSPGPLYVIIGPDQTDKHALAGEFVEFIDQELRAFNVDRLYGGEATVAGLLDSLRTLPMMAERRVVLLLQADRLVQPKKESEAAARDLQALEAYVKAPADTATLVMVADDLDRRRSFTKTLFARATVVECSGPTTEAAAERWVRERVAEAGSSIDGSAARLAARRIFPDTARLRSEVERLVLYTADTRRITEADVRELISAPTLPTDWGVTNAIERGATADALRELGAALDNGAVPYMVLGQLAWFVRSKVPSARVPAAVEAVFRTDLALKTSGGDARALLERLVVELCGVRPSSRAGR